MVGGLAIAARGGARTTRDVDVAVVVENDHQAESLVRDLAARGYSVEQPIEQEATGRLATVRLVSAVDNSVIVDLLFASSGLEPDIAEMAELLEVLPGLHVPVALPGHLIAVKVLAGRDQDVMDIKTLMQAATLEDIQLARESLDLIERRGYHRNKDLQAELGKILNSSG